MNPCSIDHCSNLIGRHGAKGYCSMHYKRYLKHGDAATITKAPRGSTPAQSLHFAGWQVVPTSGCWNFAGRKNDDGYGVITKGRAPYLAHRAAYEVWTGPIPSGHLIRHTCDNRQCINPEHLLTGMPVDNTRDAVERQRMANGERHGMHKLTDHEVSAMRCEYARGGVTQRALARRYGCSQAQVSNVLLRKQRADETRLIAA